MGSPFRSIPIIGEPTVLEWRPIVTCVCSCGKGKAMLIASTDQAVKCSGCGRVFALGAVQYEVNSDRGAMVGLIEVDPRAMSTNGRGPRM